MNDQLKAILIVIAYLSGCAFLGYVVTKICIWLVSLLGFSHTASVFLGTLSSLGLGWWGITSFTAATERAYQKELRRQRRSAAAFKAAAVQRV